jgi:hypothetical protein
LSAIDHRLLLLLLLLSSIYSFLMTRLFFCAVPLMYVLYQQSNTSKAGQIYQN